MKCKKCKTKEREGKNDICSSCRLKKWRKDNPDKIKSYLKRSKEHSEEVREEYAKNNRELIRKSGENHYIKNRKNRIKQRSDCKKKNGYAYEKTPEHRRYEDVLRKTMRKHPLKGQKCEFCNKDAEEHHHTTKPIEVDEFFFVCKYHHNKEHGKKCRDKECVLVATDEGVKE